MRLTDTIPTWKMPDDEKIPHTHRIIMRIWAKLIDDVWMIDLTKYYDWAVENKIDIEHNMTIIGEDRKPTCVMFTFWDTIDAMAFKLRWL